MPSVYVVVGCPGSGKSWICDQLKHKFSYIPHDLYIKRNRPNNYFKDLRDAAKFSNRPVLTEAPFAIEKLKEDLERAQINVVPVFIQEDHKVIEQRYLARENRTIPEGHLTRQETYKQMASNWNAFSGTSTQVLEHLGTQS